MDNEKVELANPISSIAQVDSGVDAQPAYEEPSNEVSTSRIEAFSDGVFAIAITLLVLEFKVPEFAAFGTPNNPKSLLDFLGNEWPVYVAYLTSFLTIGIIWINHHVVFKYITRSDRTLLNLNLLLLLTVSFIPYPTDLLGAAVKAVGLETPNTTTAALLYIGTLLAMGATFYFVWAYASRGMRLVGKRSDPLALKNRERASLIGVSIYSAAFIVAFFNVAIAIGITLLVALMFFVPNAGDRF